MKIFFLKWKKAICLAMVTALLFPGMKEINSNGEANSPQLCHAANNEGLYGATKVSDEGDEIKIHSCYITVSCNTKSMMLKGIFTTTAEPTEVEIYRAKVKINPKNRIRKNGTFKKIGSCKEFLEDTSYGKSRWRFDYQDNTVKTGNAYAYKYKVHCKTEGETPQSAECYSDIKRGVAAKPVGQYSCKVIKSTAKKLIVKLTGTSKKNGPLEARYPITDTVSFSVDAQLRYKNDGEDEIQRKLELMKFSYDGKKWYTRGIFAIKGKQSVYLHYEEKVDRMSPYQLNNIKISGYQYVQMIAPLINYNLQSEKSYIRSPQILFNLSSGTATVDDFFIGMDPGELPIYKWDGGIFKDEED